MSAPKKTYLDANATAPLHPNVVAALREFFEESSLNKANTVPHAGAGPLVPNPSSIHWHGRQSKKKLSLAREQVARSLGPKVHPQSIIFTSSGSESNQAVVRTVLEPLLELNPKPHWILTPVEHDSVLQLTEWFQTQGGKIDWLPVRPDGSLELEKLSSLWKPETALISSVWVNNETGVIADVEALIAQTRARSPKIALHIDAAQAWGKLPFDVDELNADYLTLSGHKIGGLAGAGAVWVNPNRILKPLIKGKQEVGRRGGTENLLGIIAMGAAASALSPQEYGNVLEPLRDKLEADIQAQIEGARVNGAGARRVSNTLSASFDGVEGDSLVVALDLAGFSVSAGSACSSGVLEPSHVLLALGQNKKQAMAAVRVSLPYPAPASEDLQDFVHALKKIVTRVRNVSNG